VNKKSEQGFLYANEGCFQTKENVMDDVGGGGGASNKNRGSFV